MVGYQYLDLEMDDEFKNNLESLTRYYETGSGSGTIRRNIQALMVAREKELEGYKLILKKGEEEIGFFI